MTPGSGRAHNDVMARPDPKCPIRTGEPCTLCHHGATGPQDCPLVYLVMDDPDLKEALAEQRRTIHARRSDAPS